MKATEQVRGLTPLRGMAAFLVIIFHYQLFICSIVPYGSTNFFEKLYLMVDLFFVLSGFIMYHVYGNEFRQGITRRGALHFVRARFARIYPLHFVTLLYLVGAALIIRVLGTDISGVFGTFLDFSMLPPQFFLIQAMGVSHEALWNSPTWSISTEWWAYMLFPFAVLALAKTGARSRWLLGLGIIASYLLIMFYLQPAFWAKRWELFDLPADLPYPTGIIDVITGSAFLRCLCGFGYGMLVYEAFTHNILRGALKSGLVFVACWLVVGLLWHFDRLWDPLAVFIFGLMILSLAFNDDRIGDFFNGRAFQYLGDISYSLYLVHMPILISFGLYRKVMYQPDLKENATLGYAFSLEQAWLGLLAFLLLTLLISSLTYKYVENPARRYFKK